MPKQGLTEIIIVIDKSGSMQPRQMDVIGGFNKFLEEQKKIPGEANIRLTLFDTAYDVGKSVPLNEAKSLDSNSYMPGGMTALLDAVGRTIDESGKDFASRPENQKPEKVIVVIMTDGEENSSKEYSKQQVKDRITEQQSKWNWEFIFLGANQDAFAEACGLGIKSSNTANFSDSSESYGSVTMGFCNSVSNYRRGGSAKLGSNQY